ncbi:hypothetical protein BC938DRAFT_481211 [Jimgerdemannia flammicorona]|uniref:Uncharacterized protein n=1 Tax=Jimgerdemannia flammicorona TaxID=994334 RepID=A0A433QGM3_9FUNG|nr:hypothetical protein BC938DRAFT_481211 [Jimgerdemannia flammicorona]
MELWWTEGAIHNSDRLVYKNRPFSRFSFSTFRWHHIGSLDDQARNQHRGRNLVNTGDAADIVDGSSVATGDSHSAQWPSVYAMNLCPDPPAYFGETTNDTANTNNANSMLPEYLDTYYVDQAYSNPPALFDVNPHSSRTSYFADENTAYMESTLAMTHVRERAPVSHRPTHPRSRHW